MKPIGSWIFRSSTGRPNDRSSLFLKQCFSRSSQIGRLVSHRDSARRAWRIMITEVGAVFFADHFGRRFLALVIGGSIVVLTVPATMQIRSALRTFVAAANGRSRFGHKLAIETLDLRYSHDSTTPPSAKGLRVFYPDRVRLQSYAPCLKSSASLKNV